MNALKKIWQWLFGVKRPEEAAATLLECIIYGLAAVENNEYGSITFTLPSDSPFLPSCCFSFNWCPETRVLSLSISPDAGEHALVHPPTKKVGV